MEAGNVFSLFATKGSMAKPSSDLLRSVAHTGRRAIGSVEVRRATAQGATTSAVIAAVKKSLAGQASQEEAGWIDRVERKRQELAASATPLTIVDFGAGTKSQFDTDGSAVSHTITKTLGEMTRSSKPPRWAFLLFRIVRELGPEACVELGSCVGISASYEAAALELNGHGRLITLEGADVLAERSQQTIDELGLGGRAGVRLGQFTATLPGTLDDLPPVGYAFIDGHHVEDATIDYMEQILPHLAPEAVLVFDDINWSAGMKRAWARIAADPRFAATVDLKKVGIAVVSAERTSRPISISYA
jgi:predicted O-methyltransferase YrrM